MTDFIVAIDLGTSHVTGIVGEKNADGTFSVIACETEDSSSCIQRGNIYNVDNTATHVGTLIRKLESNLKGRYIDKVYVGVGGQSLRTINHVESKEIEDGELVTVGDIDFLKEQCGKYKPNLQDILDIAPPTYYVDGRREINPVGIPCKRLEAHYKIVVGRSSIRRDLAKSIQDRCEKTIAGIVISPLALADAMLSKEQKELGCALVDFGAGVTSVTIYKNGDLLYSAVIPLGGNLITRDIESLQLTGAVSENLKKEYGSAVPDKDEDDKKINVDMEGSDREISVNDLNAIVEARAKEIVENVHARISDVIDLKALGYGIVLAGCASGLKKLPELIRERFKINARHSAIRGGLVRDGDDMIGNPMYMNVVSLMLKGTEQCVLHPLTPEPVIVENDGDGNSNEDKEEIKKDNESHRKGPGPIQGNGNDRSERKRNNKTWKHLIGDLFGTED
jgi:cell division protein FtsA